MDPSLEEHEEGRVGVHHRLPLQNSFGLQQPLVRIGAVQGKERQHYSVVPQEGQPEQTQQETGLSLGQSETDGRGNQMTGKYAAPNVTEHLIVVVSTLLLSHLPKSVSQQVSDTLLK